MCLSALYTKIADTITSASFRGGCEIRTHGTLVTFSGFQDQCIKPALPTLQMVGTKKSIVPILRSINFIIYSGE